MYYATHRLFLRGCSPLALHVVQVEQGSVVAYFPFDGERQSMQWVDALLLAADDSLDSCSGFSLEDFLSSATDEHAPRFLYSLVDAGGVATLKRIC